MAKHGIVPPKKRPGSQGPGSNGGRQRIDGTRDGYQTSSKTIRAKQNASSPASVKRKYEAGEPHPPRALVRLGPANTRVLTGEDDLSDWDDEELERGYRKDKNGQFRGKPPVVIPKEIHDEMVRRNFAKADKLLNNAVVPACEALREIIDSPATEDKDKLRAVGMILDRVLGKNPERVEVSTGGTPWEMAIVAAVVPASEAGDEILDVEEAFLDEE